MPHRPSLPGLRPALAVAIAAVLAACAAPPNLPDGGDDKSPVKAPSAKPSPAASAAAAPSQAPSRGPSQLPAPSAPALVAPPQAATPEPLPSLGLLLAGQVQIDTSRFLAAGIAEPTAAGVRLISNNGPGLISDKGVGLVSNNAGSLISDNGALLISDNGAILVSDNGAAMVSKTKFGLLQVPVAAGAAAAVDHSAKAVQGMIVRAISLRTREVLAGPVATDADGRYRLGFATPPDGNFAIVATVTNKETDPAFNYGAFAAPVAAPVVTNDTNDRVTEYMIKVLRNRVQGGFDARIAGKKLGFSPADATDEASKKLTEQLSVVLDNVPDEYIIKLNRNGQTAKMFAERTVSYADLAKPVYTELSGIIDDLAAYDLKAGATAVGQISVTDEVVSKLYAASTLDEIVATLEARGMAHDEAVAIDKRLKATSDALNAELSRVGLTHSREVLLPLFDGPGLEPLKAIIELLLSQPEVTG